MTWADDCTHTHTNNDKSVLQLVLKLLCGEVGIFLQIFSVYAQKRSDLSTFLRHNFFVLHKQI